MSTASALAAAILVQIPIIAKLEKSAIAAATEARAVASASADLRLAVVEAEADQRRLLLTGQLLNPTTVHKAAREAEAALERLEAATAPRPSDRSEMARIRTSIASRVALLNRTTALEREGQRDEITRLLQSDGAAGLTELSTRLEGLAERARAREARAREDLRRFGRRSRLTDVALAFVAILTLAIALASVLRENAGARRNARLQGEMNDRLRYERLRAEEANAAKSRFLAMASQDLRQPLHALNDYIATLRAGTPPGQGPDILTDMEGTVRTMMRLFNGFLDLARLEAGVLRAEMVSFPLGDLLNDIVRPHLHRAGGEPGRVRVVQTDLYIDTDPDLLEIILRNLTSTAVKHADGGKVLLGCRRIGDQVRIEVHDTGPGITPDRVARLAARAEADNAGPVEGLGLGLTMVARLTRLLGHPLSVRSTLGRGSVFGITVNRARPPSPRLDGTCPILEGLRVLIATGDPAEVAELKQEFEHAGARVVTCASAAAVRARAAERFDLYLVDMRLADATALDLLDEIEQQHTEVARALIIAGKVPAATARQLSQSGWDWITRPATPGKVLAAAALVLGRAR